MGRGRNEVAEELWMMERIGGWRMKDEWIICWLLGWNTESCWGQEDYVDEWECFHVEAANCGGEFIALILLLSFNIEVRGELSGIGLAFEKFAWRGWEGAFYRIFSREEAAIYSCGLPHRRHRTAFRSLWSVPGSFGFSGGIIQCTYSWYCERAIHSCTPLPITVTPHLAPYGQMRYCTKGTNTLALSIIHRIYAAHSYKPFIHTIVSTSSFIHFFSFIRFSVSQDLFFVELFQLCNFLDLYTAFTLHQISTW